MTLQTIKGQEFAAGDETPTIDGDTIRGILVLGLESKNAWNASINGPGDATGPRRKFSQVIQATEEISKLNGRPAYMLHRPLPRDPLDKLGTFQDVRACDKGARMDLDCRVEGQEGYHPQVIALRDNILRRRPFGGFSPRFDFEIDPQTGQVQKILAVESIDLVPQPASVRSALEGEPEYVTPAALAAIDARVKALESRPIPAVESVTPRSDPPPAPPPATPNTTAKNFAEYVRS